MSKKKPAAPKVSTELGRYIDDLVKQVVKDPVPPKEVKGDAERAEWLKQHPAASLTDKMKVIDRALKYEAIKLKVPGDGEGAWYEGIEDDDEPEE